jgi:hypothetical protein
LNPEELVAGWKRDHAKYNGDRGIPDTICAVKVVRPPELDNYLFVGVEYVGDYVVFKGFREKVVDDLEAYLREFIG